jgi:hypothetical protein
MKNLMTTTEKNDFQLISVVIPSLNGRYAKLLFLTGDEYDKLKKVAESNKEKKQIPFALYAESNISHDILDVMGSLTRTQFDELLKINYNSKMQQGQGGKYLLSVA